MTAKELEHWLIYNDFLYKPDELFPSWKHRKYPLAISDGSVSADPEATYKYLKEKINFYEAP